MSRKRVSALVAAVLLPVTVACSANEQPSAGGGDTVDQAQDDVTLTVYSGRNEELVGGILEQLEQATGAKVEVRYFDSAEAAAAILEEGEATDADLFFSQDAGALGALAQQGTLAELPQNVLDLVPESYRAQDGTWVATSARARVIAYDPAQVPDADLPTGVDDLLDPKWRGKIGFAPTNASWQAFVTGLRVLRGEDGARTWLTGFAANEPQSFDGNNPILDAVNDGQVALGLINHYYWYAKVAEEGAITAQLIYPPGGDPAGLINVAGVGMINGSDASDAAVAAVEFLLSEKAQQYFADETAEYPAVSGVSSTTHELEPLDELQGPDIDLSELASLQETLTLLQEVGLS